MNIEVKKSEDLVLDLTISVGKEDYIGKFNDAVKQTRKTINLPGFRKGKVPDSLIKMRYGSSILAQEMDKILQDEMSKYIKENNIDILGYPIPMEIDGNEDFRDLDKDYSFVYKLGLSPVFDLKWKDVQKDLCVYDVQCTEEDIDTEIENLRKRHAGLKDVDIVSEDSFLRGKLTQLDSKKQPIEGGVTNDNAFISIRDIEDDATKKVVLGLQKHKSVVVDAKKLSKGDADLKYLLGVKTLDLKSYKFEFYLESIQIQEMPDLNVDFFQKIFGESVQTVSDFRTKIQQELIQFLKKEAGLYLKTQFEKKQLELLDIQLPDSFLSLWLKKQIESNSKKSVEITDEEYGTHRKSFIHELLTNKVLKELSIDYTEQSIKKYIEDMLLDKLPSKPKQDELKQYVSYILNNKNEKERCIKEYKDTKIIEGIQEKISLETKKISRKDFVELVKGAK